MTSLKLHCILNKRKMMFIFIVQNVYIYQNIFWIIRFISVSNLLNKQCRITKLLTDSWPPPPFKENWNNSPWTPLPVVLCLSNKLICTKQGYTNSELQRIKSEIYQVITHQDGKHDVNKITKNAKYSALISY